MMHILLILKHILLILKVGLPNLLENGTDSKISK